MFGDYLGHATFFIIVTLFGLYVIARGVLFTRKHSTLTIGIGYVVMAAIILAGLDLGVVMPITPAAILAAIVYGMAINMGVVIGSRQPAPSKPAPRATAANQPADHSDMAAYIW